VSVRYPSNPDPPKSARRAVWLVTAAAFLSLVAVATTVVAMKHLGTARVTFLNLVVADPQGGRARVHELGSSLVVNLVVGIAGVLILAPLSFALQRPWRAARVAAWLAAMVLVGTLLVTIAGSPDALVAPSDLDPPAIGHAIANLLPGWYLPGTSVLSLAELAALAIFPILLALPGSGEFYRGKDTGQHRMWHLPSMPS
jgi:hypothetical protein